MTHTRSLFLPTSQGVVQVWSVPGSLSRPLSICIGEAVAVLFGVFRWQLPFLVICSTMVFGVLFLGWISGKQKGLKPASCCTLLTLVAPEPHTQELLRNLRSSMAGQGAWYAACVPFSLGVVLHSTLQGGRS
jgi:hypothetical protein